MTFDIKEENVAVAGYGEAFWRGDRETDKQDGCEILRQTRKSELRLWPWMNIFQRVRSWLRMNAGGVPNTCKSNEAPFHDPFGVTRLWLSGGRVSNAWGTCPVLGDSDWKRSIIPHKRTTSHDDVWKTPVVQDGPASD